MARSLSVAAWLSDVGRAARGPADRGYPERPDGPVVWVRCIERAQLGAAATLARKLTEEGDRITVVPTVPGGSEGPDPALPQPEGRRAIRGFLDHFRPDISIWLKGDLDPVLLEAMRARSLPVILADASAPALDPSGAGRWVPWVQRALVSQFEAILTADQPTAERLLRLGVRPAAVRVSGRMEASSAPPPCNEEDRYSLAAHLAGRPRWLAVRARPDDLPMLVAAHAQASRRAHQLLMVVLPDRVSDVPALRRGMIAAGFATSFEEELMDPPETAQVHVLADPEQLGLWYRLSPIAFLAPTLADDRDSPNPFEAAALGASVITGPHNAPFERAAQRLRDASALEAISGPDRLGAAVEALLASDHAARIAHAAWSVTTEGADVTDRVVEMIHKRLTGAH